MLLSKNDKLEIFICMICRLTNLCSYIHIIEQLISNNLFEWLQGFFIVHSNTDITAHSKFFNS